MGTEELWKLIYKAEDHYKEVDYQRHPVADDILVEAFDGETWHENTKLDEELDRWYDNNDEREAKAYYYG